MLTMSAHVMVVFICVLRILFACNISAFLSFATEFKNPRILFCFLVFRIRFKSRLLQLISLLILLFSNTCKKEQFLMLSFTIQCSFTLVIMTMGWQGFMFPPGCSHGFTLLHTSLIIPILTLTAETFCFPSIILIQLDNSVACSSVRDSVEE